MEDVRICRCGHAIDQHLRLGANECRICDYDRKDPDAPYCLGYDGPASGKPLMGLRITEDVLIEMRESADWTRRVSEFNWASFGTAGE